LPPPPGRTGEAIIPQPGGDAIGRRRIDTHFLALQALGARLTNAAERQQRKAQLVYHLSAPHGLKGTTIYLDEMSSLPPKTR